MPFKSLQNLANLAFYPNDSLVHHLLSKNYWLMHELFPESSFGSVDALLTDKLQLLHRQTKV